MRPLERLLGQQLTMARRQYKIAGYNIAGRDVLVQAIPIDRPHERVDVPLARVLKGMFDRPARD